MMYAKLALRNAKRSCGDYLIYIVTLTILSSLIFSSNIIAFLDSMSDSATNAHTLPILVTLVMAVLMNYINAFMQRRRTKELATYTLLGMEQKTVANLFFVETLAIGFVCLILGMGLGILLFFIFTQFVFQNDSIAFLVSWAVIFKAIGMTIFYFGIVQFISMLFNRHKIKKLQIYQLMYGHKQNQRVKSEKAVIVYLSAAAVLFAIIIALIIPIASANADTTIKMLSLSMISLPVIAFVYFFYIGVFHYMGNLRKKRPEIFYKNNRMFVSGQILSKLSSNSILTATLSLCLMVAAFSCIFSLVLFHSSVNIFDNELQFFMSFTQFYICIIFIVIVFTILALQQVADAKENQYRYAVLQKLGADKGVINKSVFNQIAILFTAPLLIFAVIVVGGVVCANNSLYEFLGGQNLLLSSLGTFSILLVILYSCYFFMTFKMVKRNIVK